MLHIEYRVLCSLSFEHTYYLNGRSADFSFVPTQLCLETMASHGLILRKMADRVQIMQKMDADLPEVTLENMACLSFIVLMDNPLLWNLSQFSWKNDAGEMQSVSRFYLTNLNMADGELLPRLTKKARLSEKDALPHISPQRFTVDFAKVQLDQIVVEHFVPKEKWVRLPPILVKPDQEEAEIRLNAPGLYRLPPEIAGEPPPIFLANDEVASSSSFFGVVDLYLNDGVGPGTEYITYIDYRQFGWKYILVDLKSKIVPYGTPSDITLSYTRHSDDTRSPESVTFGLIEAEDLDEPLKTTVLQMKKGNPESIENVFVFGSNVPIPILENRPPVVRLSIKDNTNFAKLPVPDISTMHIRGGQSLIYFNI